MAFEPLARFVPYATAGVEPERFGIGPVPAIRKALKSAGLTLDDIDLVELNEAFAAQVLACLRELPIDPDKLNVNGGAIALGHPLGCTGAKLTATLLYEMRRRKSRYGLVTMCVGGGMGAAGVFETTMTITSQLRKGGSWLLEDTAPADVFTPEKLTDEHRLMAQTAQEFVDNELLPATERLETKDWDLARSLHPPRGRTRPLRHRGSGAVRRARSRQGFVTCRRRAARAGGVVRDDVRRPGQSLILPLVMFGTEAQKQKYLPRLVAGEIIGAYALSESGSGSDALAARTRAVRQPDGSWRLNGEKMWISNGGFADLIVVFAKVDGEQFTAFLVERGFPGVSSGQEEHKMGLHGSSTTPIILQDAQVPADNVLGEIGKGHKVALNTLNYGRFSLGAMCAGGCRGLIGDSVRYAKQRRQFEQPIASFGAIKHKLGEMIARTYAVESFAYRTAGLIDDALAGSHDGADLARVFEEYAIESSIAKVVGTEVLDYVLDENVQIHGGNGFVKDYTAERYYRDARVNRIFEGTNEINRMLIPGMLARRAVKGALELIPAAKRLQDELLTPSAPATSLGDSAPLADEIKDHRRVQEGRPDGPRDRDADLRRQALGPAGSPRLYRGHHRGDLRF